MTNAQNNVKYAKFKISDLFEYKRGKESAPKRVPAGNIPFISETSENNGFVKMGYSRHTFAANSISVSVNYAQTVFLQPKEFCASVNIIVLVPKFKLEFKPALLYFVALLRQNNSIYSYAYKISKERLMNTEVSLPVTSSGTPDFEYMEERIRELEEERIRELEAYLQVTGLSDATLTDEEQMALNKMNMGGVKWKKFKLGDIFIEKVQRGTRLVKSRRIHGSIPLVTAGEANRGVADWITHNKVLFPANSLTIDMFGNVFYRDQPFFADDNILVFSSNKKYSKKVMLFMSVVFSKALKGKFDYAHQFRQKSLPSVVIKLPVTPAGDIDFDFMENYITAIEKQSIRGVIEYKDKVIQTTEDVVNAN